MNFEQWMDGFKQYPHQRIGQSWFNYLSLYRLDIAKELSGIDDCDCFYLDNLVPAFLSAVEVRW